MEKPSKISDKGALAYIEFLESKLKKYEESPYCKTYLTIYNQIDSFNDQLEIGEPKAIPIEGGGTYTIQPGFVDLFASKDSKEFDRVKWYFENVLELNKNLDELRALMTPEQKKELEAKEKFNGLGMAERIALENKNGKG